MIRILFVDDEPNVLRGLQRMLRSMRGEWEMQFAGGGRKALEALASAPFALVVTDMRMPEMDGAELLGQVRRLYPDIVRLVLSGQSDLKMLARASGSAHRFLTKPCDADTLIETIAQCVASSRPMAGRISGEEERS